MGTMASQITSLTIVYSTVIQAQIKENTGTGEFPAQRPSNAENVSIWWRLHILSNHYELLIRNHLYNNFYVNSRVLLGILPESIKQGQC